MSNGATFIIEKKTTVSETVELRIPYFSKNSCFAHKVIDDKICIQVCYNRRVNVAIALTNIESAFSAHTEECTEDEFNMLFNDTMNYLINMNHENT
jgi:hypothetical protein